MKKYKVFYWIKKNRREYLEIAIVDANNAKEVCKVCKKLVKERTGRNAFRPEYKPEMHASNMLMAAITGTNSLVSLSDQYNQNGMYFRGYLDGLQYALAVLGAVFNESEVNRDAEKLL